MRSLAQKLAQTAALPILVGIGFALLLAISAGTIWLVERAQTDADRASDALATANKVTGLLLNLRRAESSQRGYLMSGDKFFLGTYGPAADAVPTALAEIKSAVADDPTQRDLLVQVEPKVAEKLEEMRATIRRYDSGDTAGAIEVFKAGQGRLIMEDIRAVVERLQAVQARQLLERQSESRQLEKLVLTAGLTGTALTVAVAIMSFFLVRRSMLDMEAAQQELKEANASLETTVAERTQHLQEANDEIQSFASIVSHDLRSPLVNIMGFTTELQSQRKDLFERLAALRSQVAEPSGANDDEAVGREFDEAVGFIKGSITKMDRLIGAILVVAREGGRTLQPEQVDMTNLVRGIADGLAHKMQEIGAEITVHNLPAATTDRLAVEQVFSNLLDNAVKFLRSEAPGRIQIKGSEVASRVVYEVRDNGRGINPQDRERVFAPFRRAGTLDRQGEGMGLAHVRSLVRRLGGSVRLESAPGQGSTFVVTLPKRWISPGRGSASA